MKKLSNTAGKLGTFLFKEMPLKKLNREEKSRRWLF
jgi:hypothetical protein